MRVVSVEKGTRGAVKIGLDSGSFFLCRPVYFPEGPYRECSSWEGLLSGGELGEEVLELLARASAATAAEADAMKKLALRERSRFELEIALKKKKHAPEAVKAALERLEAEGFLSERRFADVFLRSRIRNRPEGEALLRARLAAKGLPRETVSEAIKEQREAISAGLAIALERTLRQESSKRARKGASATADDGRDRRNDLLSVVYKRLRGLGFPRGEVLNALKAYASENLEIDETDDST